MKAIALALLFACSCAFAATAVWTGRMEIVQSVTGQAVFNCQYQYAGQFFWRQFASSCPATIEVL